MKLENQGPLGLGQCTAEQSKPVWLGCCAQNTAEHPHPSALLSCFPSHIHCSFLGYITKLQQRLFSLYRGMCLFPGNGKLYKWSMVVDLTVG